VYYEVGGSAYRLFQPGDGVHVHAGDDGHEGVEVADVDTLLRHIDKILHQSHTILLL